MNDDAPVARPGLVSSVILVSRGKFLIVQEGKEICRGQWGLPGGRVQEYETFIDAAHREMAEETGYVIRPIGITRIMRYRSQIGSHVVRVNLVAEIAGGTLVFDHVEILDARWVTPEEFDRIPDAELRTPWAARVAIEDFRAGRIFSIDIMWDDVRSEGNLSSGHETPVNDQH